MTDFELEQSFAQFIDFGKIFDKTTRRYLVKYLYSKISRKPPPEEGLLEGKYFEYIKAALDDILSDEPLLQSLNSQEALRKQVIEDLLKWLKKTDQKISESNPYYKELQKLEAWAHKPTFLWKDSWPDLLGFLSQAYPAEDLDTDFYRGKFKQLMPDAPANLAAQKKADTLVTKPPLDVVIDDLLAQWDALLTAKLLTHQVEEIKKEQEQFSSLLKSKVNEYKKLMDLITPFANAAGKYWDLSRGLWKDASFDILDQYSQILADEQSIQELADLLGRMREAEIELEEETYEEVIVKKEWVADYAKKDEISGTYGSNDLNLMLPIEAALMADEVTETSFLQRFADSSLQSFRYQGKSLVTSDKVNFYTRQKQKLKEKGPFVLCIDTSGSMHGLPSRIAKVLAFAIMKMAAKEQRKCYLINFSIGIKTINLHDVANSMDQIINFLAMSFDGGTDVTPAMSQALEMLQTNDYKEADVLMVSDFIMFDIREDILDRIRREQHKGTQFHSLTLSKRPNTAVLEAFDNCWTYDPESKKVMRQLLEDLQKIQARD